MENRSGNGQGKILRGQGKVIEVYFVPGRIDILKKSQHR